MNRLTGLAFALLALAGCEYGEKGTHGVVVRGDYGVPADWAVAPIMGREFRPLLPPGPWACPGAYNDKRAKEIGLWPRPDWPLFRDCALFFYALRTPADRIDRPTWDPKTWKVEPGKRRGKTGPLAVEEFFGDDIAGILKENPKPDVPFILQLGMSRSAFQLDEAYDQDIAGYRKWLAKYPNFIGFEMMAESENDIAMYCRRANAIPDPEVGRRLRRDFPPPKDQRDWVRFAGRMWDRMKAFHFGEKRSWAMAAGCYSHLHLHGLNGATGLLYEGSASQPLCTWQVAGAFLRGASRQFGGLPFGWYMAHFYNGYRRDGKGRWGENKWCKYPWSTPDKAPKPGDRDYPHCGTSRSLVARQAAYGYLIGASFVMPENAHMLFYETDPDGRYRPSGYAKDLNDLYVYSTNTVRGVPYSTTAVLVPLSERYGHSFRGWGGSYDEQLFWFDDIFSQNALYHTLVPMGATEQSLRKKGFQGALFNSPFGEFWDVLVPDGGQAPSAFRKALSAYKCAFLIGAYRKDELDAASLEAYVRDGGTLFIPADAVTDGLVPSALAGLTFTGRLATSGTTARDERGRVFELKDEYRWNLATPATAKPLVRDDRGAVAVWANDVGKGRVVTVACWRMLPSRYFGVRATLKDLSGETCAKYEKEWWEPIVSGERKFGLFEYLFSRVQEETLPVRVEGDIHYGINRTPDGWNVWLMNHKGVIHFSEEPEEFDRTQTAKVVITPVGRPAKTITVDVAPGEWKVVSIKD